jgi:SAM-dependent methyltransferase
VTRLYFKPSTYVCQPEPYPHDDRTYKGEWQRQVYLQAKRIALLNGFSTVTDFGCGSGFKLVRLFKAFRTIGVEIDPAFSFLVKKYPDRAWREGSAYDTSCFESQLTICADVLEHLEAPHELLETMRDTPCEIFVFSTPALEILAARGQSPMQGPPANRSHIREWTTQEFRMLIAEHFSVLLHEIVNLEQATQMIVATRPDMVGNIKLGRS